MIEKIRYILIVLLTTIVTEASAQNNQVLYYMNLPQNHLMNPAMRPSNTLYIGLPILTGFNVNIDNNFINLSDIFMKGQSSDSIYSFLHPDYNVDDFLAKINDKNSVEVQSTVQVLGIGFSVRGGSYVFIDINERFDGNVVIPGDLFRLAFKGNEEFVGSKINLSSLDGSFKYYREAGLGFSKNFTNKLRIGVKGKLLFGIAAASIENRSLGITVNDDYTHSLDADLALNISGPVIVYRDAENNIDSIQIDKNNLNSTSNKVDYIFAPKNLGIGLDIGATYNISDRLMVSAAITDIGFIKWKRDVTKLQAKSQFEFSGLNMLDVINGTKTFEEVAEEMLDSLKNSFVISDSNTPFTTWIPIGITLGGSYNLTKNISLGLLSYSRVIGKQFREALTLSSNVNLSNAFSASLGYTIANHRMDNLGAGLAFRAGVFQFYFLADRIPVKWDKINVDNSNILLPANLNMASFKLGMNLALGNKIKKKNDKPMVLVE